MATAVLFGRGRLDGILLILLSLLYVTNSLHRKSHLEILRGYYEGGLVKAARQKQECENQLKRLSLQFEEQMDALTPKLKELKAAAQNSSTLDGLSSGLTDLFVKKRNNFIGAKEALEEEIQKIWSFIKLQEYGDDYL